MQLTKFAQFLFFTCFVVGTISQTTDSEVPEEVPEEEPTKEKSLKDLFCSDDEEIAARFNTCVMKLPEEAMEAKRECEMESAPEISDPEEIRKAICDDSTGVGPKFQECLEVKKENQEQLSLEAKAQVTEAVMCVTELLRASVRK